MTLSTDYHNYVPQLTPLERDTIEAAIDAAWAIFKQDRIPAAGDDRCANVLGAMAKMVVLSRAKPATPTQDGEMIRPHA